MRRPGNVTTRCSACSLGFLARNIFKHTERLQSIDVAFVRRLQSLDGDIAFDFGVALPARRRQLILRRDVGSRLDVSNGLARFCAKPGMLVEMLQMQIS